MVQALTMAIGKKGITFFADSLVSGIAVQKLQTLAPPDNTIDVSNFYVAGFGYSSAYSDFRIKLTNGRFSDFSPSFTSATQTGGGDPAGSVFDLVMGASNFSATYDWEETYHVYTCYTGGQFPSCHGSDEDDKYSYTPSFGGLSVTIPCEFKYDSTNNSYEIVAQSASASTSNVSANIPSKSAINGQESDGCFKTKVSDATSDSVSSVDFATPINSVFSGVLRTIPGSGDLGDGISFGYELADAGLAFPGSDGVTIGATGVAQYNGTAYDGPNPPTLPIPAVPNESDDHFMNIYVADWAVNGLNWAYFSAGKLTQSLEPSDLPNPSALKAETYAAYEPAFGQYGNVALHADIVPKAAPVAAFQTVYLFTTAAMELLQKQLPSSVYTLLQGFSGNAFTSQSALEDRLTATKIDSQYFATIESATKQNGMVTTQTMTFTISVVNGANPEPNVIFDVDRVDVMTDLALGTSGNAQSMQFKFTNVSNSATFVSTTIPGFKTEDFAKFVWPVVGETAYATAMDGLGQTGVAIPIAQGFSFLLTDSTLSIQDGYVSISTQLEFKSENLPAEVRQNVFLLRQMPDPVTGLLKTVVQAA